MKKNIVFIRNIAMVLVVLGHACAIFSANWGGRKVHRMFEFKKNT